MITEELQCLDGGSQALGPAKKQLSMAIEVTAGGFHSWGRRSYLTGKTKLDEPGRKGYVDVQCYILDPFLPVPLMFGGLLIVLASTDYLICISGRGKQQKSMQAAAAAACVLMQLQIYDLFICFRPCISSFV